MQPFVPIIYVKFIIHFSELFLFRNEGKSINNANNPSEFQRLEIETEDKEIYWSSEDSCSSNENFILEKRDEDLLDEEILQERLNVKTKTIQMKHLIDNMLVPVI